jgi:hypothetical protein
MPRLQLAEKPRCSPPSTSSTPRSLRSRRRWRSSLPSSATTIRTLRESVVSWIDLTASATSEGSP